MKTSENCWTNSAYKSSTLIIGVITSFQSLFTIRLVLFHYQNDPEGTAFIYTNAQFQLLSYTFLSYTT
jgi:hypothetical protein